MARKIQYCISFNSQIYCKFHAILNRVLHVSYNLIFKLMWKFKGSRIASIVLKEEKMRQVALPEMVIKTRWRWYKDRLYLKE